MAPPLAGSSSKTLGLNLSGTASGRAIVKVLVRTALPSLCVRGAWCGVCYIEGRERSLCPVFEIVMM